MGIWQRPNRPSSPYSRRAKPPNGRANVTDARRAMDDAAFKRDRLQAAVVRLGERLEQLKDQEENTRRQPGL